MDDKIIAFGKVAKLVNFIFQPKFLKPKQSVRVMYTHEVIESNLNNFEQIINTIKKTHTFITPKEYFDWIDNDDIPEGNFVLMTFDDGFLSSYNATQKVLNKYGIKAIFFVPTAVLELESEAKMLQFTVDNIHYKKIKSELLTHDEYLFMNSNHIVELRKQHHWICPHTHNHIFIKDILNQAISNRELVNPKKIIERLTKREIRAIAFPVGTEKQVGLYAYQQIYRNYKYCFTALSGLTVPGINKYKLPRTNLPADAPINYVEMAMRCVYDTYHKFKMGKLSKIVACDKNERM